MRSRFIFAIRVKRGGDMNPGSVFSIRQLNSYYGTKQVLNNLNLSITERTVTALMGPSGCGKSTLIRCLNRMNDLVLKFRLDGQILYRGRDLYSKEIDVIDMRREIGMVFQKPNPFPKSIYENIAYGLKIHGVNNRNYLDEMVEESLKRAALWEEAQERLHESALALSGGQQQRLCIARALAVRPRA